MGMSFIGQTSAHLPQLMQGVGSSVFVSFAVRNSSPEVVLVTGDSSPVSAVPVIGPPAINFTASSFTPPHASASAERGAPMGQSRFFGVVTPAPDTVTTRSMSGLPSSTASHTASAVITF